MYSPPMHPHTHSPEIRPCPHYIHGAHLHMLLRKLLTCTLFFTYVCACHDYVRQRIDRVMDCVEWFTTRAPSRWDRRARRHRLWSLVVRPVCLRTVTARQTCAYWASDWIRIRQRSLIQFDENDNPSNVLRDIITIHSWMAMAADAYAIAAGRHPGADADAATMAAHGLVAGDARNRGIQERHDG